MKQFRPTCRRCACSPKFAARLQRYADAEVLLERALELAPSFVPARHNYAVVLHRSAQDQAAWEQVQKLVEADPLESRATGR
jgi:hypothetical protein